MLACITSANPGEVNRVLADVAQTLKDRGLRVCGAVQVDTPNTRSGKCDMDLSILPKGPTIRISQNLGRDAHGCRLNPSALEQAVAQAQAELAAGADIMVINKFGKHEAEGRGFRDTIAEAASLGVPVIFGANQSNIEAVRAFCGDDLEELAPSHEAAMNYLAAISSDPL